MTKRKGKSYKRPTYLPGFARPAPGGRKRGPLRLLLGNLTVLLVLLALVFAGGEIYYRYFFDSTDSFGLTRVCTRWFERHYASNAAGVRDNVEYALARSGDRRRVSFLGDSFTAGHGIADVDDRFANRIRDAYDDAWEVHVLAANGLDTGAELQSLSGFVQGGYELDTLVLVYVLNDIADIIPEWADILQRIYGEKENENFWVKHSFFINVLYYRLKAMRDPDIANYYGFVLEGYSGPIWERQKTRLRSLKDFCDVRGAKLLVVTFPFLHDLGPAYAYRDIHDRLGAFWASLDVPHLDLLSVYEGHAPEALVIGDFDAHPNPRAHAMAAEAIGPFIEANLGGGDGEGINH